MKRIALIGDRNDAYVAHRAIPVALKLAADSLAADISWEWLHSRSLNGNVEAMLQPFVGVWCVPGSPYENFRGIVRAIRYARETRRPFLGTCGGFQHALIEYAETFWGVRAMHPESEPNAENSVIAPLMCPLVEVPGELRFPPGSRLAKIYSGEIATEEYHCRFGVNPVYAGRLETGPLKVAARCEDGSIRAMDLDGHPFFIGTLFQPERAALRDRLPPLVQAFMSAVVVV